MVMNSRLTALGLIVVGTFVGAGCELISSVDRSQITGGPACGNGTPDATEECDDGNSNAGDGCSDTCGLEQPAGSGGSGNAGNTGGSGPGGSGPGGSGAGGANGSGSGGSDSSGSAGESSLGGSDGLGGADGSGGGTAEPAGKIIYLTSAPKKANFGGIAGADAACNADKPTSSTYKALLVDGSSRIACVSAKCEDDGISESLDWVLAPNTTYVSADGTTVIGTTTNVAIFEFPLSASFGTSGLSYWTGLTSNWTSGDTCSAWTGTTGFFADEGLGDATDSSAIQGVGESCATLAGAVFACVEQ
jgi:cysteine-rich repeat protein